MADEPRWTIEVDCEGEPGPYRWGAEVRNPQGEVMPTLEAPTAEELCEQLALMLKENEENK